MKAEQIIETGRNYIGTPYVFGAPSNRVDVFDCSSFVQYVYGQHGISLPRTSRQQYLIGVSVPRAKLEKGDLLFFTTPKRKKRAGIQKIGHVAIYIGNNYILHTSLKEKKVAVTPLSSYWKKRFIGTKRVINRKDEG